jgi:hypothetical protein
VRRPVVVLAHLVTIGAATWVLAQMFTARVAPQPLNLVLWLALGAVAHDFVLLPAYSLVDRLIRFVPRDAVNHVRVPLAVSGVLLLVWFPLVLDRQPSGYVNSLGHEPPDFLGRWLAVSGGIAALSAVVYAVRRLKGPSTLTAGRAAAPPRSSP